MIKLKKYHGDLVQSLGFEQDRIQASIGVVGIGEFDFGTMHAETIKVTSGEISVWHEKANEWIKLAENQSYKVPAHCNYKLKADKMSSFICFYE